MRDYDMISKIRARIASAIAVATTATAGPTVSDEVRGQLVVCQKPSDHVNRAPAPYAVVKGCDGNTFIT